MEDTNNNKSNTIATVVEAVKEEEESKVVATTKTTNSLNLNRFQRFLNTGLDKYTTAYKSYNAEINVHSLTSLLDFINKENGGVEAVELIKKYKRERLVVKCETLVFSLALCARSKDAATKKAAYDAVTLICDNPIDFFRFVNICESISFEISFKMNSASANKLATSKNSVDIIIKKPNTPRPPVIVERTASSRQSSAGLKPLLALRLSSGKSSQQGKETHSDVIIETSTAEIFSSRKTSAASTLRSELTFLATERKDSAISSQVTHLPSLPTPRQGSAASVRKGELPLISERTNSGKSRNQTPLHVTRPGSAKPEAHNTTDPMQQSRRFSDSHTNSTNELAPIVSPANVHASYPSTNSPSLASFEPKSRQHSGASAEPSKPPSRVASATAIEPPKPAPRLNSGKAVAAAAAVEPPKPSPRLNTTVRPSSGAKSVEPLTPKSLNFASSVEIIPSELLQPVANPSIHPSIEKPTVLTEDAVDELKVIELNKKHVVLETKRASVIKADSVNGATGWGRAHRRAISSWYTTKDPKTLVFLITKFQKRIKWTHKDVLRLAHPKSDDAAVNLIFKYITKGFEKAKEYYAAVKQPLPAQPAAEAPAPAVPVIEEASNPNPDNKKKEVTKPTPVVVVNHETLDYVYNYLEAVVMVKNSTDEDEVVKLIEQFHFHLEHVSTKLLKKEAVFLALVEHSLPLNHILRSLNKISKMTRYRSDTNTKYVDFVCSKLKNKSEIDEAGLTSLTLLNTWRVYEKGHSEKGKIKKWTPNASIVESLDSAFHASLNTGTNSTKKVCVLVNVWRHSRAHLAGCSNLNPLEAATFMCLKHLLTEPNCKVYHYFEKLNELEIKQEDTFKATYDKLWNIISLGLTQYHNAIESAINESLDFDVFVIYTNLTLLEGVELDRLMKNYRLKMNKPQAKLIVVSLISSLQPVCSTYDDPLMCDVLGFSQNTPNVIANFISDKF